MKTIIVKIIGWLLIFSPFVAAIILLAPLTGWLWPITVTACSLVMTGIVILGCYLACK